MADFKSGRLVVKGVSFLFGEDTPFPLTGFKRGVAGTRAQDVNRVRRHGRNFGRDLLEGPTHDVSLAALSEWVDRVGSVAALMAEFESVMDAASELGPGELVELWIGDRFCLGRPRDLDALDDGAWNGTAQYGFAFAAESKHWYGPPVDTEIRLRTESTGGLPIPAAVPFVLGGGSGESGQVVQVDGVLTSWPVFTLHGPVKDPYIDVPGVGRLQFKVDLAYDQVLEVSTLPWATRVRRNGAPLPGALSSQGARLSDMGMRPGAYRITFGGYDPTSTSRLFVRVMPMFPTFVGGR